MKKISRRNFLLASGVVTIGAALTACGGSSSTSTAASSTASSAAASEAPAAGGKTLNIWCWNDEFQSRFNDSRAASTITILKLPKSQPISPPPP